MNTYEITKISFEKNRYDFQLLEKHIQTLIGEFPFLQVDIIGKSMMGKPIYLITLGEGKRRIHLNGSHHANEWITTYILMKCIEKIGMLIKKDTTLLKHICYDFIPMVNPDGVALCLDGLQFMSDHKMIKSIQTMNEGSEDFSRWKANIRGVDLNRNYNAGFEAYKKISEKRIPSYAYYQGRYPESEPETKAVANLTRRRNYQMVMAFHTQGEVIYWDYDEIQVPLANKYAIMFSKVSGYALDKPEPLAASGGYKDWFIKAFHRPGFTIECGRGENPIPISQAPRIIDQVFPIIVGVQKDLREGAISFGSLQ